MQFSLPVSTLILALASTVTAEVGFLAWDNPNFSGRKVSFFREGNFFLGTFADR
jgi:hypothetical protein